MPFLCGFHAQALWQFYKFQSDWRATTDLPLLMICLSPSKLSSYSNNIMAVVHTTEELARAVAPVKMVVSSFLNDDDADAEKEESPDATDSQGRFVSLVLSIAEQNSDGRNRVIHDYQNIDWKSIDFLPSRRYVHKLVQCFISTLEERNIELEDDSLASLVCHFSMAGGCKHDINVPDPTHSCISTFSIPLSTSYANREAAAPQPTMQEDILHIRTYPHHNDVGVSKVWEAGACLAEYIIHNPQYIRDRHVVELGAGVGLTGLVAAGVAKAKSVHMSDYTEACLDNLAHNVSENRSWLLERGVCPETVTVGKLEWGDYSSSQYENYAIAANKDEPPWEDSFEALSNADVLIAADVVYDVDCIPTLVATVSKFLRKPTHLDHHERIAIFATTYRNEATFALFEKELEEQSIACTYDNSIEDLPNVFPCYFTQPRSDVRVCRMEMKQ